MCNTLGDEMCAFSSLFKLFLRSARTDINGKWTPQSFQKLQRDVNSCYCFAMEVTVVSLCKQLISNVKNIAHRSHLAACTLFLCSLCTMIHCTGTPLTINVCLWKNVVFSLGFCFLKLNDCFRWETTNWSQKSYNINKYTLTNIIKTTLLVLPPFFMSWTQRSKTFSTYTKGLFLSIFSQSV